MQFPSKIFLDGADPTETREADKILKKAGHTGVHGQTTNPSLIAKKLAISDKRKAGSKNGEDQHVAFKEAVAFYRKTVKEIAKVTKGPISIQVIGNASTSAADMLSQARDRLTWIPNGVIKFPCTKEGLAAAEIFCQEGPVNLTLAFSQEQAAAVFSATRTHNYDVYFSPFVGRLDDRGEKGMDVVANILEMYRKFGDEHVRVITSSVRNVKHILYALWLKSDAITIPFKVFQEWADQGFPIPKEDFFYDAPGLTEIPYKELSLELNWQDYDIRHQLTEVGVTKFWEDWKNVVL